MRALSYTCGVGQAPLIGETIGENLRRTVEKFGDREALVSAHQGFRATYGEFWDLTTRCARALMARGVGKGDRVGIWATNRYEWAVVQYALNQAGISFLILARENRGASYVDMLGEVRGRCPELREAVVLEDGWEALLADAPGTTLEQLAGRERSLYFDDPINIQYTSGTTGFPKGATLSHHNILNNGFFIGETLGYSERDRVCIPVPFYHCFGMVLGNLACTTHGACMVVPNDNFDPLQTMRVVEAERCTSLYGVPTMFIAELEHPDFDRFDFSSLRTGIMAGSPCPVEVMKKVQSKMHMPEVTICYGMTETSPVSTQTALDDPLEKRVSTVGRVHPWVEIKIVDPETGAIVPRGTPGELCTRGYCVMLGYWNNPEATREAIDAARWMHTGDLATMDGEGYLNIVGRIKDMIIRGGENIYPREIEEFLYTHPEVSDVQVIGVPSEKYGEEVMAWVKTREGSRVTPEELTEYCRGRIAHYKVPRYWKLMGPDENWPMTVSGKIQKFKMREMAIEELGLHRAAAVRTA